MPCLVLVLSSVLAKVAATGDVTEAPMSLVDDIEEIPVVWLVVAEVL